MAHPSAAAEALRQLDSDHREALLAELDDARSGPVTRHAAELCPMTAPNSTVSAQPGRRRWTAVLAVLGPGLITAANAGNDAGGILTPALVPNSATVHCF